MILFITYIGNILLYAEGLKVYLLINGPLDVINFHAATFFEFEQMFSHDLMNDF